VRFTTEHVELVHNPPYRDWSTCLTSGSTAALEVALRIFCNRGDTVLAEEYTYPGLTETAKIVGVRVCGVGMDAEGLKPDHLDRILSAWKRVAGPKPKMLYVIPSGQNPTGTSQSSERRRAIYDVAERHDLIIIEDDPYYFLHTGPFHDHEGSGEAGSVKAPEPYLHKLLPSYLSFDHSGRVVRLDSTSKILAPGLRAGWVTANTRVVEKFLSYQEFSTSVAGPTQLMLFTLLESSWGHRGFFTWLEHLSAAYRRRRDAVLRACEELLPRDTCQWVPPEYGMFLWIRLDLERPHGCEPGSETHRLRLLGIENDILGKVLENGVQVTKGSLFGTGDNDDTGIYFRLTFAAAAEEQLRGGVRRFAAAVSETLSLVATQSAPSVSVSTRQERVDRHAGVQGHIPVASG
jgi:aromatic amino acid aminotransferase I